MRWLVRGRARRARRVLADVVPDRVVLARRFKRTFGRRLNLRNAQAFNEKLHWMMLYFRPPLMRQLADKCAVRRHVAERVGPHILNELYGAWDRVGDIDFSRLPDTFVLKVNWGWRMNLFCRDRATFDVEAARRQLAAWMRRSHYFSPFPGSALVGPLDVTIGDSLPLDDLFRTRRGPPPTIRAIERPSGPILLDSRP